MQLENSASPVPQVHAAATTDFFGSREDLIRNSSAAVEIVARTLKMARPRGRRATSVVPPEFVRIVALAYPAVPSEREGETILRLMAERLDGPLDDYVLDYVPIRHGARDNERSALVAVCARTDVIAYLELLRSAGLHVDTLEIGPLAIRRLIAATGHGDVNASTLVINTGTENSFLTMLSGQRLLSDQKVDFGEQRLLRAISQALDITDAEATGLAFDNDPQEVDQDAGFGAVEIIDAASTVKQILKPEMLRLVDDIERAFLYAASEGQGAGIKQIFVLGSLTRWPLALDLLRACTPIVVNSLGAALAPFWEHSRRSGDFDEAAANDMIVAMGLALRGLDRDA